jgi:hypothetical protein
MGVAFGSLSLVKPRGLLRDTLTPDATTADRINVIKSRLQKTLLHFVNV